MTVRCCEVGFVRREIWEGVGSVDAGLLGGIGTCCMGGAKGEGEVT